MMTAAAILTEVTVATGDPRRPWATALAFDGDPTGEPGATLTAVGQAAELQKLAGGTARRLSAAGRSMALPPGVEVGHRVRVALDPDGRVTGILVVPTP